jgi:uncharacterized membrane protein
MELNGQTPTDMTTFPPSKRSRLSTVLLVTIPAAIISLFLAATPPGLWEKARIIGYALCHQLPQRSFFIHEHQTPLCARCTGMYLGFSIGLIFMILRRRTHAARMPPTAIIAVLIGFITIMGIDGINSTISIIPGAPQLYHTTNIHRIVTGTLFGIAMCLLFFPVFSTAIWRQPSGDRSLKNWRELIVLVLVALALDAIVLTQADWLFYPITILSIAGPLLLLSFMGAIIVLTLRNLVNNIDRWKQMALPMFAGVALGLVLITMMDFFRASITAGG